MLKPKKLSPKQRRISDRCKKWIAKSKDIPTEELLKQAATCREDLGL